MQLSVIALILHSTSLITDKYDADMKHCPILNEQRDCIVCVLNDNFGRAFQKFARGSLQEGRRVTFDFEIKPNGDCSMKYKSFDGDKERELGLTGNFESRKHDSNT